MQVAGALLFAVLAAGAEAPGVPASPPPPGASDWLSADGVEAGDRRATPESRLERARLLAAERSWEAASRTFEGVVRGWPASDFAERAMLDAAAAALEAGQFDRALALVTEMRARWPEGRTAAERDRTEVRIGEVRLERAGSSRLSRKEVERELQAAYKVFAGVLRRDRLGPAVERATLGRARSLYRMGKVSKAVATLEVFLREFPGSPHSAEAWRELAVMRSGRVRERSPEGQVLDETMTQVGYVESYLDGGGEKSPAARASMEDAWKAIAARQAELKIDEARLYLRMRRPEAAEWVLRSVLRRYGETPAAARAARMLEDLSGK